MNSKNDKLIEKAIHYRGSIIHWAVTLELIISTYICRYFCGRDEKRIEEMISLIFADDRMTLNSKAQIFYHIASTHDKEWYDSYKSVRKPALKKNLPITMNNDLVYVIEERNVMAHRYFDGGEIKETYPMDENVVRFAKIKNVIEPLDYDDKKYLEVIMILRDLISHIGTRATK